jgi:hypothetical protein
MKSMNRRHLFKLAGVGSVVVGRPVTLALT